VVCCKTSARQGELCALLVKDEPSRIGVALAPGGATACRRLSLCVCARDVFPRRLKSQFALRAANPRPMPLGNIIPEFRGLRVRMGVHTALVHKVSRHSVTNRVVYDNELVNYTTAVSDAASGGQIIVSSETLAEAESTHNWAILHLGAHLLKEPLTAEQRAENATLQSRLSLFSNSERVPPEAEEGAWGGWTSSRRGNSPSKQHPLIFSWFPPMRRGVFEGAFHDGALYIPESHALLPSHKIL